MACKPPDLLARATKFIRDDPDVDRLYFPSFVALADAHALLAARATGAVTAEEVARISTAGPVARGGSASSSAVPKRP